MLSYVAKSRSCHGPTREVILDHVVEQSFDMNSRVTRHRPARQELINLHTKERFPIAHATNAASRKSGHLLFQNDLTSVPIYSVAYPTEMNRKLEREQPGTEIAKGE
jgi:hypothetical protein